MIIRSLTMVVTVKHVQLCCSDSEDDFQLWSVLVSQHKAATSLSLRRSSTDIETLLSMDTHPYHSGDLDSTTPGLVSGASRLWKLLRYAPGRPSGEGYNAT